jgi:hypothetical protein
VGQALVAFLSVRWLPAMHEWHSGLIPYPILLASQLIMLAIMIQISRDIWRGSGFFGRARPSWSRYLVGFSAVYAGAMMLRYILTMILLPEMRWLGGTIQFSSILFSPLFFSSGDVCNPAAHICKRLRTRVRKFAHTRRNEWILANSPINRFEESYWSGVK